MFRFINTELKSDSDLESESESKLEVESKSDTKLMAKLKSDPDSEWIILLSIFACQKLCSYFK